MGRKRPTRFSLLQVFMGVSPGPVAPPAPQRGGCRQPGFFPGMAYTHSLLSPRAAPADGVMGVRGAFPTAPSPGSLLLVDLATCTQPLIGASPSSHLLADPVHSWHLRGGSVFPPPTYNSSGHCIIPSFPQLWSIAADWGPAGSLLKKGLRGPDSWRPQGPRVFPFKGSLIKYSWPTPGLTVPARRFKTTTCHVSHKHLFIELLLCFGELPAQ